jgi:UDP-N-acetyl-2-amino-2-deoxyglucuronate dehydrogenase
MNIGIHFFDLMTWLFGAPLRIEKYVDQPEKASGYVELEWASLKWFLSVDRKDMPEQAVREGKPAFRSITVDGQEIEFSTGFTELHTQIYKQILAGDGFGLSEAKQAIQLVHDIRNMTLTRGNI